jgi:hypothetical protein
MNKELVLKTAFGISVFTSLLFILLKILHLESIPYLFVIAITATGIYTILALIEIFSSDRIKIPEKVMWFFGFIVINTVTGIVYFISRRNYLNRSFHFLPK